MHRGTTVLLGTFALGLAFVACRDVPVSAPSASVSAAPSAARVTADAGMLVPELDGRAMCALAVSARSELVAARPFAPNYPHCPDSDHFCDTIDTPPDPKDTCFVANRNIAAAERESRAGRARAGGGASPWNRTTVPKYLDRVQSHFHLNAAEIAKLRENGFVVLDRLAYADYASAFHDVFQEELPLWVSLDAAFHAVFRGTELVLERVERARLEPALGSLLKKLRAGLSAKKARLPADTARDLDLYLGVALGLADPERAEKPGLSLVGRDEEIRAMLTLARAGEMTDPERGVEMFGRARVVDFSQLVPRGHYEQAPLTGGKSLASYFQAMMWLSRLELNLVSRSCRSSHPGTAPDPSETPREATMALALAEIARDSGALVELGAFEEIYGTFAGKREDVSVPDLLALEKRGAFSLADRDAPARLRAAIGADFQRTARTHFMPEGAKVLPAIATLMGPRIVPDVAPLTRLVHDRTPGRFELGAADVGYVLGHDRAKAHLAADLGKFPALGAELTRAREELAKGAGGRDVYAHWLRAILALGAEPVGVVPSFFTKDAYRDRRLESALVGFGQLRHAFVLLAAQGYDAYGCEIPDAFVEPALPAWDALLAHVRSVRKVAKGFAGLERVIAMLRDIAFTESTGAELSDAQRRWLGMVSEHVPNGGYGDTTEPPKWTGWWFDMFEDREIGAGATSAFVADVFTLTNAGKVKYLGAEGPRLGVFVVDVNGAPRAMVGPVAKGYETETPIAGRLDEERALAVTHKAAPWRESFAAAAPPPPTIGLRGDVVDCSVDGGPIERRVVLRAEKPVGKVSVTLLDHHGDPLGPAATVDVDASWKALAFALPASFASAPYGVEALHVRVHELAVSGAGNGPFDATSSPSVFAWKDPPSEHLPRRWKGVTAFSFGVPDAGAPPGP